MKFRKCNMLALVTLLAAVPVTGQQPASWGPVQWTDDRGVPLPADEAFEVCRIVALERQCDTFGGRDLPRQIPAFDVLQMESPGHGPLALKPRDLVRIDSGGDHEDVFRIAVPRKAWLHVEGLPEEAVTLSLYPQEDPAARRPSLRVDALAAEPLRIPAAAFLASLSAPGWAPDLSLIHPEPGEELTLHYRQRSGWSLVLRSSHRQSGEPVPEAELVLEPAPGYSGLPEEQRKVREAETGAFGLAIFSGLEEPLMEATFQHVDFLPMRVAGLSASRGTFSYRDVPLPQGGGADIEVLLDGRPVPGARCALLKYRRDAPGSKAPPKEVFGGTTDEKGLCQPRALSEGVYQLRIEPPSRMVERHSARSAHVDRAIQIVEAEDVPVEVILEPTLLQGTVTRGGEPAPGYDVMVIDREHRLKNTTSQDALIVPRTDEEGHYEVTIWAPGEYSLFVQNQGGVPGAWETVRLDGGTESVDFQLAAEEVTGRVVDEDGLPLEEADVQLRWNTLSYRRAMTGTDGRFSFPVEEEGQVELTARKHGFQPSEPLELQVGPETSSPPVVITLARRPELQGRLVTAAGGPVPGGWLMAYRLEVREPVWVSTATTEPDGRFELPVVPGEVHRLFFGGPRCPLGVLPLETLPPGETLFEVRCAEAAAHLHLTLRAPDGAPREGEGVLLARGQVVFPRHVVAGHLARYGLPAATDGSGQLALVALEPGEYGLYLAGVTSPFNILVGAPQGFLTKTTLAPWSTRWAEITLDPGANN